MKALSGRPQNARRIHLCFPFLLLAVASAVLVFGCGYTIKRDQKITSVRLGRVENMTYEPGLADRFYEALALELARSGVGIGGSSEYEIRGALRDLSVRSVAEQDGVTVVYELTIEGDIYLDGPGGSSRKLSGGGSFIVNFYSGGSPEEVTASRQAAIAKALADFCEGLAYSVVNYQ